MSGTASTATEPGGRTLGELVHEVLAFIPQGKPDLAEDFVRYFARRRNLGEKLARHASVLVHSAQNPEAAQEAVTGRSWQEVPFASMNSGVVTEGAIDLLVETDHVVEVTDFKTDSVTPDCWPALEALYARQLEGYVAVVRRLGLQDVAGNFCWTRGESAGRMRGAAALD